MIANAQIVGDLRAMGHRCEGITAAGEQCRCWAITFINGIPYCKQHAQKELALAMAVAKVRPGAANEVGKPERARD